MNNGQTLQRTQLRQAQQALGHQATKHAQDTNNAKEELKEAISGAQDVLAQATTVFPFTLFPDTVTVDREKMTVTHRIFFMVAEVVGIRIEDILNVTADVGPFFGSLKISTRFFSTEKPYVVNYLWRKDALRLKRIMQGYITAIQKKIDCSVLTTQELTKLLDDLGRAAPNEEM